MKKFTLFACLAAALAFTANAQYTVDPTIETTLQSDDADIFDLFVADETITVAALNTAGKTIHDYRVDDETRFLYVWDSTFNGGDGSYPGVGYHTDGYVALEVASVGWSGAGFYMASGIDLSHISSDTHFHAAFRATTYPTAVGMVLLNPDDSSNGTSACFSIGSSAFDDNGTSYPLVGDFDRSGGEWVGIDLTFSDIAKLWSSFSYVATSSWIGNVFAILAGGVQGTDVSLDAVYFYSPASSGISSTLADTKATFVVTSNTINVAGASGIELYNLGGALVRSVSGSVLGIDDLAKGIYIAKSGNQTEKIVVR